MHIPKPSSSSSGSVAIQLANDMEGRDEPYEAEAHDQYYCRRNLEARRIVCVEPEHVASATATAEPSSSASAATARRSSAPQASRGSSAAAGRRPRGAASGDYRSGLGLRGASRHGTVWSLRRDREIEGFRISGNSQEQIREIERYCNPFCYSVTFELQESLQNLQRLQMEMEERFYFGLGF